MDPNTALAELEALAARALADLDERSEPAALAEVMQSLAERFDGLNVWLSNGGALPRAWRQVPRV